VAVAQEHTNTLEAEAIGHEVQVAVAVQVAGCQSAPQNTVPLVIKLPAANPPWPFPRRASSRMAVSDHDVRKGIVVEIANHYVMPFLSRSERAPRRLRELAVTVTQEDIEIVSLAPRPKMFPALTARSRLPSRLKSPTARPYLASPFPSGYVPVAAKPLPLTLAERW